MAAISHKNVSISKAKYWFDLYAEYYEKYGFSLKNRGQLIHQVDLYSAKYGDANEPKLTEFSVCPLTLGSAHEKSELVVVICITGILLNKCDK